MLHRNVKKYGTVHKELKVQKMEEIEIDWDK
jgi:hypothetical protein